MQEEWRRYEEKDMRPPICRRTLERKRRNTTSSTATVLQQAILLPRIPILHVRAVEDGSDGSNGMSTLHPASYKRHDLYLPSNAVHEGKIV